MPAQRERRAEAGREVPANALTDRLVAWFPLVGFFLGLVMWLVDAMVDAFLIHPDEELVDAIWSDQSTEIWMRTLVVIVMTGSALLAQYFMRRQARVERLLRLHQEELEMLVEARTRELERIASSDPLTGLYNRRKLCEVMALELQRAARYGQPLAVVMCDIDHFKRINDRWGHDEGDQVLKAVADVLRGNLRASDVCARWGGEEFMVLLPQAGLEEASLTAEKLRQKLSEVLVGDDHASLTASFGVSELQPDEEPAPMVKRADKALYQAKREGRNRVCVQP